MDEREARELFEFVKLDFVTLRNEWRIYRSLFGTNPETVELLNSVSGRTAAVLERALFERVLLGLRKLTDPARAQRRNRRSVTIKALLEAYDAKDAPLKRLVGKAERSASFARDWSSRKIAHSDFEFREGTMRLESASRHAVEVAMERIARVIRWISEYHFNTSFVTHLTPNTGDDCAFLQCLFEGQIAVREKRAQSRQRMKDGRVREAKELLSLPEWLHRRHPPVDLEDLNI